MPHPITTRRRILEVLAVLFTALGKFVFMDWLKIPLPFVLTVGSLWIVYILARRKNDINTFFYWGFRKDNFLSLSKHLALPSLFVVIACVIVGYIRGTIIISWHIFPLLLLYPLWGTIQQSLCMGLVAGNLHDIQSINMSKSIIILVTAVLFGAMHLPNIFLSAGTFIMALVYGIIYLKEKNLFVLGILHGWLGAIFYYTVVGIDQWGKFSGNVNP